MRINFLAVLALALALGGCKTTGTTSATGPTVEPEQPAAATQTAAADPAPSAEEAAPADPLAGLSGKWKGTWGSGTRSTLTISGTPDAPSARYCFGGECWGIDAPEITDGAIAWGDNRRFRFRLDGTVLRGQLHDRGKGRTWKVKMRRAN